MTIDGWHKPSPNGRLLIGFTAWSVSDSISSVVDLMQVSEILSCNKSVVLCFFMFAQAPVAGRHLQTMFCPVILLLAAGKTPTACTAHSCTAQQRLETTSWNTGRVARYGNTEANEIQNGSFFKKTGNLTHHCRNEPPIWRHLGKNIFKDLLAFYVLFMSDAWKQACRPQYLKTNKDSL